tara:strand:+ start:669 stop:932 length:264 start_codon:yes stop_codon:yes gene_type:complete
MSFNKDAKIHKLQDENDRLRRERTSYKLDKEAYRGTIEKLKKELDSKEEIKEILYSFIEFYTVREIDRLDMRILADRFIDEQLGRDE